MMSWQGKPNGEKETGECEDVYLNYQAKSEIYSVEPYEPIEVFLPSSNDYSIYVLGDYDGTSRAQEISGYNNTKVLKAYNYQARYIVHPIIALSALSNVDNFSSWYIPSIKELTLLAGDDKQNIMACFKDKIGCNTAVGVVNSCAKLADKYYEPCMGDEYVVISSTELNSPGCVDAKGKTTASRQIALYISQYGSFLNAVAKNAPLSVRAVCAF
jgi:hypothetical protein